MKKKLKKSNLFLTITLLLTSALYSQEATHSQKISDLETRIRNAINRMATAESTFMEKMQQRSSRLTTDLEQKKEVAHEQTTKLSLLQTQINVDEEQITKKKALLTSQQQSSAQKVESLQKTKRRLTEQQQMSAAQKEQLQAKIAELRDAIGQAQKRIRKEAEQHLLQTSESTQGGRQPLTIYATALHEYLRADSKTLPTTPVRELKAHRAAAETTKTTVRSPITIKVMKEAEISREIEDINKRITRVTVSPTFRIDATNLHEQLESRKKSLETLKELQKTAKKSSQKQQLYKDTYPESLTEFPDINSQTLKDKIATLNRRIKEIETTMGAQSDKWRALNKELIDKGAAIGKKKAMLELMSGIYALHDKIKPLPATRSKETTRNKNIRLKRLKTEKESLSQKIDRSQRNLSYKSLIATETCQDIPGILTADKINLTEQIQQLNEQIRISGGHAHLNPAIHRMMPGGMPYESDFELAERTQTEPKIEKPRKKRKPLLGFLKRKNKTLT